MEDWNDWLDRQGLLQCSETGLYGDYGDEVHYLYDYDEPVSVDPRHVVKFLARKKGFQVEWSTDELRNEIIQLYVDHDDVSNLYSKGEWMLSWSDTDFMTKEERLETYLLGREDIR